MSNKSKKQILEEEYNALKALEKQILQLDEKILEGKTTKEALNYLAWNEMKYRALFENSNDAIFLINHKTAEILDVNQRACETTLYSKEELINMTVLDLHASQEQKEVSQLFDSNDSLVRLRGYNHKRKDGKLIPIEINSSIISIGENLYNLSFIKDISEELIANRKQKELAEINEQIIQTTLDGFLLLDIEGNLIEVNTSYVEIIGYSRDELLQMNIVQLDVYHSQQQVLELHERIVESRGLRFETKHRHKTGNVVDLDVRTSVFEIEGNIYVNAFVRDISDYKKYESELIAAKEKAEESDRLKSAFLATMSHELRTPLNGIIGFSQILAESIEDIDLKEYSEIISKSGMNLLAIIEQMFETSIIEAGQVRLDKEEIILPELMETIYHYAEEELKDKKKDQIACVLDMDPVLESVQLESDITKLKQVFMKVIGNAVKFTESGKVVIGAFVNKENQLVFYVKDTGVGIPKEKEAFVFDRFRQLDNSHTREYGGIGLGTNLCKKIIELLNGKIWFESEEGVGTTFFFTIPGWKEILGKESAVEEEPDFKQLKILVAEDDAMNYQLIEAILQKYNPILIRAINGLEAVEMVEQCHDLDMILMDIRMPQMNGIDAAELIKEKYPNLPIIALTAYSLAETKEKIMKVNFDGYLAKPVEGNKLARLIQESINQGST